MKSTAMRSPLKRFMRYVVFALVLILLLILGLGATYLISAKSSLSGVVTSATLNQSVQIQFDANDVPHIKAKSQNDAFYTLGFLHATERSWQLEVSRRLASGRLSEILGERTVSLDRFLRTLGIKFAAEKQYERYPTEIKQLIKAYADGVNAGNQSLGWALPIEYLLTGSQPGHWSPTDSVAWSLMMALDLGDNWQKELFRLELSQHLTTDQIWDVMPPYPGNTPVSNLDFAKLYKELGVFKQSPISLNKQSHRKQDPYLLQSADLASWISDNKEGLGSNNWVLAGKKTVSGKPLLANDPHLGLSAPSTWYFAHLEAPGLNVMGATLPGIPAVVLGRTNKIAWGFTNTGPDVQDLYLEKIDPTNPNQYIGPDGPLSFLVREEIIKIKNKAPFRFVIKQSRHGPVISDSHARAQKIIDTNRFALTLRWTALDVENQTLLGGIMMNRADSMESFKSALRHHYAPMQTVAIADTQGNIALQAAGTAPRRQIGQGLYGVAPALGWERQFDWTAYLPFEQLPSTTNPDSGWLASANQQIISSTNTNPLTGDWDLPFRYDRIKSMIEAKDQHDRSSMQTMQGDTLSLASYPLMDLFKQAKTKHPLQAASQSFIQSFDGSMARESVGALIFNAWADQLTRILFSRLGDSFKEEYGRRNFRAALLAQTANPNSPWCDVPNTSHLENCQEAANMALDKALSDLKNRYGSSPNQWQWGQAHQAVSEHRPFKGLPFLSTFFNVRVAIPGDAFTVNVGRPALNNIAAPYQSNHAASLRAIYDLNDLEQSVFMFPTGQSGWVQSEQYRNLSRAWSDNGLLPLTMNPAPIIREIIIKTK